MTHVCENCRRPGPLYYSRRSDEYLCDECLDCVVEEIESLFDSPLEPEKD